MSRLGFPSSILLLLIMRITIFLCSISKFLYTFSSLKFSFITFFSRSSNLLSRYLMLNCLSTSFSKSCVLSYLTEVSLSIRFLMLFRNANLTPFVASILVNNGSSLIRSCITLNIFFSTKCVFKIDVTVRILLTEAPSKET